MEEPAVSVILPAYNRASTLRRAICSVLSQPVEEGMELIVVDDASTDDTTAIVNSFQDQRLRYLRRPANGGASAARNAGVTAARGRFLAFIDSDDEWLPYKLEKQLAALRGGGDDIGLVLCGLLRWDTRQAHYLPDPRRRASRAASLRRELLRQNFALTSCWLVRRECFETVGLFDESLKCLVDWEWLIRCTGAYGVTLLEEPLVMVYQSPDSISGNPAYYTGSLETLIKKHEQALADDPRSLANLYYVLGKKYILHGMSGTARARFLRALYLYPWDVRAWVALMLSVAGRSFFTSVWKTVRRSKGFEV